MGEFFRIDETENAVDYLEKAGAFHASRDPNRWKWLVISLHGALYGFAICAIQGTDPSRVTEVTKRGEKLISLDEALKRCQSQPTRNA